MHVFPAGSTGSATPTHAPAAARTALWSALLVTGLIAGCSSSSSDTPKVTDESDPTIDDMSDGLDATNTPPPSTDPPRADGLPAPVVPMLDPFAAAVPGPDPADPFGTALEIDTETAIAGGAPTTPKNLRTALVSNDWAELDWAPSNDDGRVVAYRIYRSDGHVYDMREDDTLANTGAQAEIDKMWATTSFIDCNYTRFLDRLHDCASFGPMPGETYSYQVTAIDEQGQESPRSDTLTVRYHDERGAPVPRYEDFYLNGDDTFTQDHDLSRTAFFLDDFQTVFEEEFDLGFIDGAKWNTSLTWGDGTIINGEQQYFVDTQKDPGFGFWPFSFNDDPALSTLTIRAVPTPDGFRAGLPDACNDQDAFGIERCAFLSGALSSHDRFGLTYGYVEGRMKMSSAAGALSSFYLYHRYSGNDEKRHAPEIDIVEYLGENPYGDEDAFQTYHYDDAVTGLTRSAPTMNAKLQHGLETGARFDQDFHTFGVLWEPQLVIWYIDGVEVRRMSGPQVARQQMNIVTYLVAGSEWAPTPDKNADIFPLSLEIDWIRAWQRPVFNGNGLYPDR